MTGDSQRICHWKIGNNQRVWHGKNEADNLWYTPQVEGTNLSEHTCGTKIQNNCSFTVPDSHKYKHGDSAIQISAPTAVIYILGCIHADVNVCFHWMMTYYLIIIVVKKIWLMVFLDDNLFIGAFLLRYWNAVKSMGTTKFSVVLRSNWKMIVRFRTQTAYSRQFALQSTMAN